MQADVKKHYDLLIEEGDDPVHDPDDLREYMDGWDGRAFMEELLPVQGKDVLEIGVGTGRLAVRIASECGKFTGIDISPKTVSCAKENLKSSGDVTLVCADFLEYSFANKFDLIYSSLTFFHIREKEKAVRKVSELLRREGKFVLSLDKSKRRILDFGTRRLCVYPDSPKKIVDCGLRAGLVLCRRKETARAYILTFIKK